MTTSIENKPVSASIQQMYQPIRERGFESLEQVSSRTDSAQISIVTDEGDIVTLSRAISTAQSFSSENSYSPQTQSQQYTLAILETDSFDYSVQGDLNEEELADIKALMKDLSKIADDFFRGDLEHAMKRAMNLGEMGSTLDKLSATFSRTAAVTTNYIRESHPMPQMKPFPYGEDQELSAKSDYADMLRAQWQQIKEMLEGEESEIRPDDRIQKQQKNKMDAADQMMQRAEETISRHPRLSPFMMPLANRAIDTAVPVHPDRGHSLDTQMAHLLKGEMFKHFDDWLNSVAA
ncbi:MAG: hypothetical protein KKA70_09905 [Proteobacteria bacterium]|nr:hypothetical protein [Pseudomonadota bacterium]